MPSVPDRKTIVRRRALVSQIKDFGQKEFGLPRTRNFSRYHPDKSWCFFVIWCSKEKICQKDEDIDEKLFFDRREAVSFCRKKTNEGMDAFVLNAAGFVDENKKISGSPLTPNHIKMKRSALASLILHEDFHVWIRRSHLTKILADSKIEESLAEVFGDMAAILCLQNMNIKVDYDKACREGVRSAVMICRVHDLLERIYKNSNLNMDAKKSLKKKMFAKYKKVIFKEPRWCLYKRANFASLYIIYIYSKYAKIFYDFFRAFGDFKNVNLKMALRQIKIIDKKSKSPKDFIRLIKEFTLKNKKRIKLRK